MAARKRKHDRRPDADQRIDGLIPPGRLLAIRILVVVALAISAYLAFLSFTGSKAAGCGPDSGCDQILSNKRWSTWFGVPVSLFAVLADSVFLAGTFHLGRKLPLVRQRRGWAMVLPSAALLAGAALWFVFLQTVVLRSICPYCMATHAAGLLAALLALAPAPISRKLEQTVGLTKTAFRRSVGLALVGLTVLVTGQIAYTPKTYIEISQDIAKNVTAPSTARPPAPATNTGRGVPPARNTAAQTAAVVDASPGASPAATGAPPAPPAVPVALPTGQRPFALHGGRFYIDVMDVPTLGSPTNTHVAVTLQDFTCSHCRELHGHLVEAQHIFSNQLVIATIPMPFDPNCNPIMKRHNPKHTNACDYAKLSLAVFRANRAKQHDYDEFLFAGEKPPPLALAQERAAEAVGFDALTKALADPWVEQQIRLGIALYDAASRAGYASLPQLMVGQQVHVGILSTEVILDLLAKNLGLTVKTETSTGHLP